jgi:hypothetical protein
MKLGIDLGGNPGGIRLGLGDPPADLPLALAKVDVPGAVVVVEGDAADAFPRGPGPLRSEHGACSRCTAFAPNVHQGG